METYKPPIDFISLMFRLFGLPLIVVAAAIACFSAYAAYRESMRGHYRKHLVVIPIILAAMFFGLRLLFNCFWSGECSLTGIWPEFDLSAWNGGWIEFGAIIFALGIMMVYGSLVAASYALPPILLAFATGSVIGRTIWLYRKREGPPPDKNERETSSGLRSPPKAKFGKKDS